MSSLFTYIATKSTVDPYIAAATVNLSFLARDVSDAFVAISGGHVTVGQLAQFPLQRSVPNHLLCDGRQVAKASFPELYDFIGDSQGTSTDANYFVLPNYLGTGALAPAPVSAASAETVVGGTVTTPDPTPPPPTDPPVEAPLYGDVDSGGRFRRIGRADDLP